MVQDPGMAYDPELAARIRALLGDTDGLREQRMFGGLAFLVNGHMAVAASGQGGLMVRVDSAASADLVRTSSARVLEMRGRPMPGWLRVCSEDVADDERLAAWIERGATFARSLPPKV